ASVVRPRGRGLREAGQIVGGLAEGADCAIDRCPHAVHGPTEFLDRTTERIAADLRVLHLRALVASDRVGDVEHQDTRRYVVEPRYLARSKTVVTRDDLGNAAKDRLRLHRTGTHVEAPLHLEPRPVLCMRHPTLVQWLGKEPARARLDGFEKVCVT